MVKGAPCGHNSHVLDQNAPRSMVDGDTNRTSRQLGWGSDFESVARILQILRVGLMPLSIDILWPRDGTKYARPQAFRSLVDLKTENERFGALSAFKRSALHAMHSINSPVIAQLPIRNGQLRIYDPSAPLNLPMGSTWYLPWPTPMYHTKELALALMGPHSANFSLSAIHLPHFGS